MHRRLIEHHGITTCADSFGDPSAPTILMVMGAGSTMLRYEEDLIEGFTSAGYHVVRYDQRDVGQSTCGTPGEVDYTVRELVEDAVAVLDDFGLESAHVLGCSMGGMVAQLLAIHHPDRVRSIVPVMSSPAPGSVFGPSELPPPEMRVIELMVALPTVDWSDPDSAVEGLVMEARAMIGTAYPFDEEAMRAMAKAEVAHSPVLATRGNHGIAVAATPSWRDQLGSITAPTLVIHGEEDPILPLPHGQAIADGVPGARLVVLPGVGHELPRGCWETVTKEILAFLPG